MFINDNGDIKEIGVKTFDTLPVGAEIDYNGTEVPEGYEEVQKENIIDDNEWKKVDFGTYRIYLKMENYLLEHLLVEVGDL